MNTPDHQGLVWHLEAAKLGASRIGCYFCFKTLDLTDTQPDLGTFIQCGICNKPYHQDCLRSLNRCLSCGNSEFHDFVVETPVAIEAISKPIAISTIDTETIYYINEIGLAIPGSVTRTLDGNSQSFSLSHNVGCLITILAVLSLMFWVTLSCILLSLLLINRQNS